MKLGIARTTTVLISLCLSVALASGTAAPARAQLADLPIGSAHEGASSDAIDAATHGSTDTLPDGSSISAGSSNVYDSSLAPQTYPPANPQAEATAPLSLGTDTGVDYGPSPTLLATRHVAGNSYEIDVWSPANHAVITNLLLLPEGGLDNTSPRPTFYLLSGADGGANGKNWRDSSDYESFFAGKNVQVVTPIGGGGSMYLNWLADDPTLGRNQWETYICEELPQIMDTQFHGTGRDAIAGLSMSGGPSIHMAGDHPERFHAAASLSGFPANSGQLGRLFTSDLIESKGGDPANALGDQANPAWLSMDPVANLDKLRGIRLFVGTGAGVPTLRDLTGDRYGFMWLEILSQVFSNYFTRQAESAGLAVNRYYTVFGAHNYTNFEREMRVAWEETIAPALGVA